MKLVADENFPRPASALPRAAGHDVLEIAAIAPGASDRAVLEMARDTEAILVTLDRDHGELVFTHSVSPPSAIIFLRARPADMESPALLVGQLLQRPDLLGGFWVIDATSVRRRPLPHQS